MTPLSSEDLERLVEIWEAAVSATHTFLHEGAIDYYRPLVRDVYLPSVEVTVARDAEGRIQGFIGLAREAVSMGDGGAAKDGGAGKIEMLFVHPEAHNSGIGRALVDFAKSCYPVLFVDVNEQNPGAMAFYTRCGFDVRGRSALDAQGNPYPLVHMRFG